MKSIDEHRTHRERMVLTMLEGDTPPEEPLV
jgi:hypothetical protein